MCVGVCGSHHIRLVSTSHSADAGVGLVALLTDDDRWGLVCDDWWDDNAARVICTCLGYTRSLCHSLSLSLSVCLSVCLSVTVPLPAVIIVIIRVTELMKE